MVRAVGLTLANVPEAWVSDAISADLKAQQVKLVELHIDRAYLSARVSASASTGVKHLLQSLACTQSGWAFPCLVLLCWIGSSEPSVALIK